jgi:hypothetical protein
VVDTKASGSLCTSCRKDTRPGSGRFVNRIPSGAEDYDGYLCAECIDEAESDFASAEVSVCCGAAEHGSAEGVCGQCNEFTGFERQGLLWQS